MRIVPPVPAEEITSSAFAFNIRISDVNDALCGRLETAISQYFSRNCAEGVIARNESDPTILDVACKIRYEKRIKQFSLVRSLRTRHIPLCFPEGYLGKRNVRVDARPIESWDASTVTTMHSSWSTAPWRIVYASDGKQAGRAAGSGLQHSFPR